MARKLIQVAILLAVCAWLASACKDNMQVCCKSSDCCSRYCYRFRQHKNGLCRAPLIRSRLDLVDDEGAQGSNEDDFIENEEDDSFDFDEEIEDDKSECIPSRTPSSTIGKQCAHYGTPCSPKSNFCCSGRCVQWRHDSIFRCARRRRGWGRTSTAKPTSARVA